MESDERREIIKIYWQQYLLLEKRMIELSDYVAIDRKNYATFSNQFISMYLIICSEIDSVADEYCKRFLEQDDTVEQVIFNVFKEKHFRHYKQDQSDSP